MATVPTAPLLSIRPKVTSQTLEFWWRPPTSDGGSPITTYILSDGTNFVSTIGNPGYYKVTGLTNGQSYTYSLAASNSVGISPYSFYRTVQPGDKPDPPTNVSYADQGSGNVLVSWTNPANIGGTTNLLGMMVRAYQVTGSNANLSSFSTLVSIQGGVANANYIYQFKSLSLSNDWLFQVQLQNDPGRTLRTLGFTSTFISLNFFVPNSLSSLQLWLDANEVNGSGSANPAQGSAISTWVDKSGLANNAIGQSNPTFSTLSSLSTVYFNSKSMNTPMRTGSSNYSVFITVNHSPAAGYQRILNGGGAGSSNIMFVGSCNAGQYASFVGNGSTWTDVAVNTPAISVGNQMSLLEMVVGSGSNYPFVNGSNQNIKSATNSAISSLNIGGLEAGGGAQMFTGYVGEILFYSTVLGVYSRYLVEGHLAWKWGISTLLPTTHPFYTRRPLSTDSNLSFSPSSIGTMRLWLDAADLTTISTSGSSVIQWSDKSGSNNNATGGTSPSFTSSNLGVVFSGSQVLNLPDGTLPINDTDYSIFFNVSASNVTSGIWWLSQGTTNSNVLGSPIYNGAVWHSWGTAGELSSLAVTNNTPFIASMTYTSGTRLLIKDGTWNNGDAKTGRATTAGNARIGKSEQFAQFFTGNVREVLVYQSNVTLRQRQQVEGYMAWKWGLQTNLPASHLYYNRAPTRLDTFTSFSPSSIGAMQLWLDATQVNGPGSNNPSGGATVSIWVDKSGVNRNAIPYTGTVVYSNATSSIYFNGSSGLITSLSANSNLESAFIVAQLPNVSPGNPNTLLGSAGPGDGGRQFRVTGGGIQSLKQSIAILLGPTAGTILNNSTFLAQFTDNGTTLTHFINGSTIQSAVSGTYSNGPSTVIGYRGGGLTEPLTGHIFEILCYQSSLSAPDRQRVEGYLTWKWGIQNRVPASHPFRFGSTISLGPIASS